jgi:integrase
VIAGYRKSDLDSVQSEQGIVRLEVSETKNEEARIVYRDDELKEIFEQYWELRKKAKKLLPYVFLNRHGTARIGRFDKAWKSACKDAKIGIRIFQTKTPPWLSG